MDKHFGTYLVINVGPGGPTEYPELGPRLGRSKTMTGQELLAKYEPLGDSYLGAWVASDPPPGAYAVIHMAAMVIRVSPGEARGFWQRGNVVGVGKRAASWPQFDAPTRTRCHET